LVGVGMSDRFYMEQYDDCEDWFAFEFGVGYDHQVARLSNNYFEAKRIISILNAGYPIYLKEVGDER